MEFSLCSLRLSHRSLAGLKQVPNREGEKSRNFLDTVVVKYVLLVLFNQGVEMSPEAMNLQFFIYYMMSFYPSLAYSLMGLI